MTTPFERKVYAALLHVPCGRVTTYAELARAVGCRSSRAVGQALKRNPFAPDVPCHRVIRSDLAPGGFKGRMRGPAPREKIRLLKSEGVLFRSGRLAELERLVRLPRI